MMSTGSARQPRRTLCQGHRNSTIRLFVQGIERIKIVEFTQTEPYLMAKVQVVPDTVEQNVETQALMRNTVDLFRRMSALMPYIPEELIMATLSVEDPRSLLIWYRPTCA